MPPEYSDWNHVPSALKNEVLEKVGKLEIQRLMSQGDFLALVNGTVEKVVSASEVSAGVLSDAKKQGSSWHLIRGLPTSRHAQASRKGREALLLDETLDTKPPKIGGRARGTRGNPRSLVRQRSRNSRGPERIIRRVESEE